MRALVYTAPETLVHDEMPDPIPAHGEVLVRVDKVGICGSDMHAYLGHDERRPAPLVLGHEAAGIVETGPLTGRRVTINPLVTCGICSYCTGGRENLCPERQIISMPPREGAFAERIAIPPENLIEIPDGISFERAALAEPIACGWHAARLGREALGEAASDARILVLGGGAIGVGSALSLMAQGNSDVTIIEPNTPRREYLENRCQMKALHPDQLDRSDQFELVVDAVGFASTREQASAQVRPGGVIMHIGLGQAEGGLDIRRMTLQEITFIGTYTYTADDFRQTATAIFDGRLGALEWTETMPLSEGARAFKDIRSGQVSAPKIILDPSG